MIVALLAEGHILVEDYPGVGKTALARALSRSIDCQFARVQCTADLLPADIVGTNVYNQREARFEFRPGPIFANVVLVDEVNRASPKTQSGLLECMQERHVTVDAHSHELARPFLVFATQNPVEYEGTYPLPEAQVDRFMVRLSLGYPDAADEAGMLAGHEARRPRARARAGGRPRRGARRDRRRPAACTPRSALRDYIVALLRRTRARRARRARRLAARRPDAAARRQGARARRRAATTRCPTTSRRCADAVLAHRHHARPRGGGRRARRDRRGRRSRDPGARRRPARCARRASAARASGCLLLLVAGTLRRRAAVRHRLGARCCSALGAAAWIGLGARGARRRARDRPPQRRSRRSRCRCEIDAFAGRLPLPPGWIDEPLLPEPVRFKPAGRRAARARGGHVRPPRAAACSRRPRSSCATRSGSPSASVRGAHADELLVLPRTSRCVATGGGGDARPRTRARR